MDMQATEPHGSRESREALIAVLRTASQIGVDIDLLCHRSVQELIDDAPERLKPYAAGMIYQIGACLSYVLDRPSQVLQPAKGSATRRFA